MHYHVHYLRVWIFHVCALRHKWAVFKSWSPDKTTAGRRLMTDLFVWSGQMDEWNTMSVVSFTLPSLLADLLSLPSVHFPSVGHWHESACIAHVYLMYRSVIITGWRRVQSHPYILLTCRYTTHNKEMSEIGWEILQKPTKMNGLCIGLSLLIRKEDNNEEEAH